MDTIEAFVGIKCTMLLIIYLANSYVTANLLYIENREQNTSGLSVVSSQLACVIVLLIPSD